MRRRRKVRRQRGGRCDGREVECDCLENNNGRPSWVQIPLTPGGISLAGRAYHLH